MAVATLLSLALLASGILADREIACGSDRPYDVEVSAIDSGLLANEGYINRTAGAYEPNSLCEWRINSTDGTPIEIILIDVDTEFCDDCRCDGLRIWEGSEPGNPEEALYTFCGVDRDIPKAVIVPGHQAYIQFYSDSDVPTQDYRGFLARYGPSLSSEACSESSRPHVIDRPVGMFASPNWPADYPSDSECQWILKAPEDQRVRISFLAFQLEGACNRFDTLRIYDGNNVSAPMLGQWDDHPDTLPPTIVSRSNEAFIRFSSDYAYEWPGFLGFWEFGDE